MSRTTKKILQAILYLIIFYFLGRLLYQNWQKVSADLEQANLKWLALALAIFTITLLSQSINWHLLLKSTGKNVAFSDSYRSFFRSGIVRYLPGGIWGIFSKVYWIIKLGIGKSQALFLVVAESVIGITTGSFIFLATQPPVPFLIYLNLLFFVLAFVGIIMLLSPKYLLTFWRSVTKQQLEILNLPFRYLSGLAVLSIAQWLLFGAGIYWTLIGFHLPIISYWPLAGIFAASWVVGFVVFLAPTGLGVREGFITLLLSNSLGPASALMIAMLTRFLLTIGEIFGFILSLLPKHQKLGQKRESCPPPAKKI